MNLSLVPLLGLTGLIAILASTNQPNPIRCDLSDYHPQPGLEVHQSSDALTVTWRGQGDRWLRMGFDVQEGAPIITELSVTAADGEWGVLASDLKPEFRVVSGVRRVTQQQTEPLGRLGVPLTIEKLNEIKWDAFWDAPLYTSDEPPLSHQSSIPAAEPFLNHPGLPRKPEEIVRATATYAITECRVETNGARVAVAFSGVEAGIFKGRLVFDVFRGSNLIRQMLAATTDHPSAAFKFDAGLSGLPIGDTARLVWRDLTNNWQDNHLGGPADRDPVIVKGSNRLIAAELAAGGAIAAFPPPHSFYWARESEQNLGYGWYRKDDDASFSFGVRQAESEDDPEFEQNFALYNARPGTWQRMPVFYYISPASAADAVDSALAFTRGDHFKALPGHKVFGAHYHVGLVKRLKQLGGFDQRLNDIATMKAVGVDIYGVIDGARGPGRKDTGEVFLNDLAEYYEAARRQSDEDFLVMPNDENSTGGRKPFLGGHYDIMVSKPLFWRPERREGRPLAEDHPSYGTVYNLGTPSDMIAMAERENVIISMPHPRSKRSTGFLEAIKDEPHFQHERYFGLGYRWGMGIDASATRLGEFRFLKLWDEVNNWMAAADRPPKFALAISESRSDLGHRGKPPWDDTYGMSPVNYLRIDEVPTIDDMSTVIDALRNGDYFVTSGEILLHAYAVDVNEGAGVITADVEWTFPLEFVELVWGDGENVGREVVAATDRQAFGREEFLIPFEVGSKKWIRFAVWDVATNGLLGQPTGLD